MSFSLKSKLRPLAITFSLLIFWTLVGFYSTLDNSTQSGCIVSNDVFAFQNICFSVLSISLLSVGYFFSNYEYGKWIIAAEVAFWTYKLFFIKEGYVVGIGGIAPVDILTFDFIALLLRLFLLKQVFNLPLRLFALGLIALLLMIVKVEFFT